MYLLVLGIILVVLKWQEVSPVAAWSWWWVLLPFVGAFAWWQWADWSGHNKRKAMKRDEQHKQERIERQRNQIGLPGSRSGRGRGRR
jgi:small Trp-rich protein